MRTLVRRTRWWALLAAPLVLALAACEPVAHSSFTVRESPASAVTFRLLSGDASQVVVTATAAGATVPGPGVWRVDRSDGSVVELPAGEPTKISSDGERVLVGTSLWSSGSVLTPPSTVMSEQLSFALFVDTDGQVKTWETATGTVTPVETGFPRPAGTTSAIAKGVSDDGRTVQYELQGSNRIERFVDLDAGAAVDRPNGDGSSGQMDRFVLAARGDAFLHIHQVCDLVLDPEPHDLCDPSWAELVKLPSGAVARRYTNPDGGTGMRLTDRGFVSASGQVAWVHREQWQARCTADPTPVGCVTSAQMVTIWEHGDRSFSLPTSPFPSIGTNDVDSVDVSARGRFLVADVHLSVYTFIDKQGLAGVIDRSTGSTENLWGNPLPPSYTETNSVTCSLLRGTPGSPCSLPAFAVGPQISDDGRVIATTSMSGKGWYEYEADPPAAG